MIKGNQRDAVRIIELPACKMMWSGICQGGSETSENEALRQFNEWWPAQDKLRQDRFYTRDFMWWDPEAKGFAWGLAVTEIPADCAGYGMVDFPGGLYAVANYADGGHGEAKAIYESIKKWIKKSGCFALDEGASRYVMWHGICSKAALAAMGYMQYDLYVPLRMKGEEEK